MQHFGVYVLLSTIVGACATESPPGGAPSGGDSSASSTQCTAQEQDATRCAADWLQRCDNQTWKTVTNCAADGGFCTGGAGTATCTGGCGCNHETGCEADCPCDPNCDCTSAGATRCADTSIETCVDSRWTASADCAATYQSCSTATGDAVCVCDCDVNGAACDLGCGCDTACASVACTGPAGSFGDRRCNGSVVDTCVAGLWLSGTDCATNGSTCTEVDTSASCVCSCDADSTCNLTCSCDDECVCTAGESECLGATALRACSSGQWLGTTCDNDESCSKVGGTATCVCPCDSSSGCDSACACDNDCDPSCAAGEMRCAGNVAQICEQGQWQPHADCNTLDLSCEDQSSQVDGGEALCTCSCDTDSACSSSCACDNECPCTPGPELCINGFITGCAGGRWYQENRPIGTTCGMREGIATWVCIDFCPPEDPEPEPEMMPEIYDVDGNGSVNSGGTGAAHHVADGLVITGNNLAEAAVVMIGSTEDPAIASQSATEILAILPEDIQPGEYTLEVGNLSGYAQVPITLLQGEAGAGCPN